MNCFHGRIQKVMVEVCISDWRPVISDSLGPLLVVAYINDLGGCVEDIISKFAD